jgi:DNA-binding CsgD family transcriptional regulator
MPVLLAGDPATPEWADAASWLGGVLRAANPELWATIQRMSRLDAVEHSARLRVRLFGALMSTELATEGISDREIARFSSTRDEAERLGDWYTYTNCVYIMGGVLAEFGRLREAEAQLGSFLNHRTVLAEAGCAMWRGRFDAADALVAHAADSVARDLMDLPTERHEVAAVAVQLAVLRCAPIGPAATVESVPGQQLGTYDATRVFVDACARIAIGDDVEALERMSTFGWNAPTIYRGFGLLWAARLHLALGDAPSARSSAESALRASASLHAPAHTSVAELVLGECCMVEGVSGAVEHAYEALESAVAEELWILAVDALEAIGSLLIRDSRVDDGARLLVAAEAERERYRYRVAHRRTYVAEARAAVGESLLGAQGPGLGLQTAIELARRIRGEHAVPSLGTGVLSRAERAVVALVAEGLTNREVATRLHVSHRTVDSHVSHALLKLGMTSRVQLASYAARHGLP